MDRPSPISFPGPLCAATLTPPTPRPDAALLPASGRIVADIEGVNARTWWKAPLNAVPQVADNTESGSTLFVDVRGRPLIVRRPRPVGFRPR